ncbi:melanoma-associated antigen B17 [Sciurus carolinensis]|uniref:melanoma-associated antigen B17 n=1 Tax=Sciurus carolinensis TaxID=30640 RepID=UPI001FB52535|nr:melanoma-associated antigen B17 [Sciurus carolinensis]
MPRGQKSKLRAREKRRQARGEDQGHQGAQATEAEEEEFPSPSPVSESVSQGNVTAGTSWQSLEAQASSPQAAASSCVSSDESAKSEEEENPNSPSSSRILGKDPLTRKAGILVQFLLHKYNMKEPIIKADMLKIISRKYRKHFPEILRRTTERMELVFGLDLKEADPSGSSYSLVSKMDLPNEGSQNDGKGFPKNGLLMPLLGLIFMNDNCVSEEEMWEFLNMLGLYDGRKHFIFGEPRKLVTKDLVQEKYLEYRQVPHSDPPRYEFLWGPKAHAETSKMQVLEFLAKVNGTVPSVFQARYEEALRDEEERFHARVAARVGTPALPGASSHRSSQH